mgnify:CR=1 FL=1
MIEMKKLKAFLGYFSLLLIVILIISNYYFNFVENIENYVFLFYLLVVLILNVNSKIPVIIALFLLVIIPFLLYFEKNLLADQLTIYAYYFLIIGVIKQIRNLIVEKINKKTNK